jgi:hypothetical protein
MKLSFLFSHPEPVEGSAPVRCADPEQKLIFRQAQDDGAFRRRLVGSAIVLVFLLCPNAHADGRAGTIEFSDGHKLSGAISLTPGKQLKLFTATVPVTLALDEVKEIHFKPEKEEMREGYYFPNAGQATQAKTGEIYPVRYVHSELTLADGKTLEGHLFTTMLYVEADDSTQKVVLEAKQTGTDGEKMADLIYPTAIQFDVPVASAGLVRIDLAQAGFTALHPPLVMVRPDLSQPLVQPEGDKPAWSAPTANPAKVLFAVEASDGIHLAWPAAESDPGIEDAVKKGLADLHDFFDTRDLLGCFTDGDDVYSLVMLKRVGRSVDGGGNTEKGKVPWSLVVVRWKFDADQKKVTLLNRVLVKLGGIESNPQPPPVLKEAGLLNDVSAEAKPASP